MLTFLFSSIHIFPFPVHILLLFCCCTQFNTIFFDNDFDCSKLATSTSDCGSLICVLGNVLLAMCSTNPKFFPLSTSFLILQPSIFAIAIVSAFPSRSERKMPKWLSHVFDGFLGRIVDRTKFLSSNRLCWTLSCPWGNLAESGS